MTLKNDEKFEEKLTCGLENDIKNLQIFSTALESFKIGTLVGSLYKEQKIQELEIYRRVMCYGNEK